MKYPHKLILITFSIVLLSLFNYKIALSAVAPEDVFLIKSSAKSMDEVVNSVKKYVKEKKWVYIGDFKVKKGQVILVKFCVKAAGKLAWKAGLKVSAMLPCGNVGVYQNKGKTEVSVLTPYYMTSLYPNENLTAAADLLMPMYKDMLSTIVK